MSEFYFGIVEDRTSDPLMIGRCKVRIFGVHTPNRADLPTADLPWAMCLTPTTSASIDGIGISPTGIVEGTTVMVVFADRDQQIPIIMGTLPSIPIKSADPLRDNTDPTVTVYKPSKPNSADAFVTTGDGSTLTDSSGNPVTSGYANVNSLTCSEAGYSCLRGSEGLASLVKGGKKIGSDKTPMDTTLYAYQDTKGIWTIGWGSTKLLDGTPVNQNTVITKRDADMLLQMKMNSEFAPGVKRKLQVPVTQAMFDALCNMCYNMGLSGMTNTSFWTTLNSGGYKAASDMIPDTKNNGGSLTSRRLKEKALFLADGIPANVKVDK